MAVGGATFGRLHMQVVVESGAGVGALMPDEMFTEAGATKVRPSHSSTGFKHCSPSRTCFAKFGQHPDLARYLVRTGNAVLVEAAPNDAVWGIGMAADDPRASDPARWPGLNLLGFALMTVRAELASGR